MEDVESKRGVYVEGREVADECDVVEGKLERIFRSAREEVPSEVGWAQRRPSRDPFIDSVKMEKVR